MDEYDVLETAVTLRSSHFPMPGQLSGNYRE
jgi:hypothetical protein